MKRQAAIRKSLGDLVGELRERRLLVPIIALALAILAVPFVLGGGDAETVPPVAPPVAAAGEAAELEPAVLLEEPGVRNYRQRLAALRKKNPFDQQFAVDPQSDTIAVSDGAGMTGDPSVALDSGTSAGAPAPETSFSAPAATAASPTAPQPSPASPAVSGPSDTAEAEDPPKPITRFYAGRIDVKIGVAGALKTHEDVRYLEFLPSAREPVVTFVGLAQDGEQAVFAVSREVGETDGDGSCAPKRPAPCQFVRLAVGDEQTFTYGGDAASGEPGTVYRMKLLDARIVQVPELGR